MSEDLLTKAVIGIAMRLHTALGPGLLENTYKECLYRKLLNEGFNVEKK